MYAEDEARLLLDTTADPERLAALVARRIAGEPLEHLLGWVDFAGVRVAVAPGVFVPRRRTELLVERAEQLAPPHPVVVDLCCGCGAIGAALAARLPTARVYAADIDPAAVRCARRNLPRVHEGDLYDALPATLRGRVDLLVVNAPYVPTGAIPLMPPEARDHEPPVALDGGADGLDLARRIAAGAPEWLTPGGHLLIETSRGQAGALSEIVSAAGLRPEVIHDDELDATVVTASR